MKIAITGATGFVGQNLTKYLSDFDIVGVSRQTKGKNISYKELSLNIFSQLNVIIHLAGKAHDLKKTTNEEEYFEINTELTKSLFDKFLKSDCTTFIYMSSVKAVADKVEGKLNENFKPIPSTAYGKSKMASENYILSKNIPEGKRVYILRPCMIHGPNNKGNLNLLYSFVASGFPYPFGIFLNKRSFISVDNVCFIIKELICNTDIKSGIYNLADDDSLSSVELVQIISEALNKSIRILKLPKFIIKLTAKAGDILPLPLNSERLHKLTENYEVSNRKIKIAVKKDLPLSAKDGIRKTITSFQTKN